MKRFALALAAAAVLTLATAACGAKETTYTNDDSMLPEPAKTALAQSYAGVKVTQVKVENETVGGKEYEVYLADGTKIDFDAGGAVEKVKAPQGGAVPAAMVPDSVAAYVAANHPGQTITEFDVDRRYDEVKLSSGLELKFDKQGQFVKVDD